MIRGTFASTRARNEMTPEVEGSCTVHYPDGERMPIHAAAARYREEGVPLVVIAGASTAPARRATGRPRARGCSACAR